jgi:anti-anti-sigma factor
VSRLTLRGDYDIWRRDELRGQLEQLDLKGDVHIDLSGVTLMDAGSVALLIALRHRLQERTPGARVILEHAPRIVRRVIEICGALELFVLTADR